MPSPLRSPIFIRRARPRALPALTWCRRSLNPNSSRTRSARSAPRRQIRKLNKFEIAWKRSASADADEGGPQPGKDGADKHVMRAVAEHATILAHGHAQRADIVIARGVKHAGHDGQHAGHKIHHRTLRKGINIGCTKNKRPALT